MDAQTTLRLADYLTAAADVFSDSVTGRLADLPEARAKVTVWASALDNIAAYIGGSSDAHARFGLAMLRGVANAFLIESGVTIPFVTVLGEIADAALNGALYPGDCRLAQQARGSVVALESHFRARV
jgi:hypothetical protein